MKTPKQLELSKRKEGAVKQLQRAQVPQSLKKGGEKMKSLTFSANYTG
jgi:hypothetical protein